MAQVAQLYREAEPVVATAPLADRRQIRFRKGVVSDEFFVSRRKGQQAGPFGWRQQVAAWHGSVTRFQILVNSLTTNPECLGQLGFRLARMSSLPEFDYLIST